MDERPPRSPNPKPEIDLALRPIEPGGPLFAAALFDKVMGPKAFLSLPTHCSSRLPGFRAGWRHRQSSKNPRHVAFPLQRLGLCTLV